MSLIINKDLKNMTLKELEKVVVALGEQKFQAKNIFAWIQAKYAKDINEMTNLSKKFREHLVASGFYISNLKVVKKLTANDGTVKYLFELPDGKKIETVLLDDEGRQTLCISTQVGCKMACTFCFTGRLRFQRNLIAAEIIDQIIQVEKNIKEKINNVVYMGMGEPFDNYDEVMKSVRILNDKNGRNLGARHITLSTCGVIPGIQKLAGEDLQIRLAVSLHAATDTVRDQIMKIGNKYPIEELIKALREYQKKTGRRITFEYVMLKDFNDTRAHARGLMKLLSGLSAHVNLIEYNEHEGGQFTASDKKTIKDFKWLLTDRGFETTIRYKRGREIKAACGQLGAAFSTGED